MGSLLGSIFGEGSPTSGDTFADRLRAQYAPGAYQAHQTNMQQQAIYSAMLQNGASPEQAQMLAASPQAFQAGQGAYMPQANKATPVNNSDGSQTILQESNPGGPAGHSLSISGIPITPPGTTASPAAAAGGARSAQAAPATQAEQNENAPAPVPGAGNTLQGMPGSTNAVLAQIKANKAAGKDATLGLPDGYKAMAQAVIDGRETLKDITSTRGAQTRNAINEIVQTIEPNFDENMNEARQTYRKQYVSGKATDIGGQIKSLNKLAGHANAMADASTEMDNIGLGGSNLAVPVNKLTNMIYSTPGAGLKRAADLYTNELSSYVSGKGGSGVDERQERSKAFSPNQTPQSMGKALLTDIDFLEKQMQGNEQHRNSVFTNPKMQEQFPLVSPQALEQLNQAKIKAHKLVGDYDEWAQSEEGKGAQVTKPPAVNSTLPQGWRLVK